MNYKSISDLNNTVLRNLYKIPHNTDLIVGIPRSGMLPANLLALYLNIPYTDIHSFIEGRIYSKGRRGNWSLDKNTVKNVIVIDDSVFSGEALIKAKGELAEIASDYNLMYCTVYQCPASASLVDIYMELVDMPRVFQWNIFHHSIISSSCVDIDGVLCVDPSEEENDDGEKYREFLLNAKPLHLPTVKIHTLVSCRLEKYRDLTKTWLEKYNVQYENLILLDLPDKKTRMEWGKYGEYKAQVYQSSNCSLFIESSLKQANIIAGLTCKPVFCIESFDMIKLKLPYKKRIINKLKKEIRFFYNS